MKEQSRQHRYDYSRSPSRSPSRSRSSRASSRHDDSRRQSRSRSVTPEYRSSRRRGTKRPRSVSSNPSAGSHRSRGRSSYRSRAESRERSYSSGSSRSRTSSPKKRTVHRLPGAGDKTINQQRSHNISTLSTDRASLAAAVCSFLYHFLFSVHFAFNSFLLLHARALIPLLRLLILVCHLRKST